MNLVIIKINLPLRLRVRDALKMKLKTFT
jgi:hypothetical protein